MGSFSIWHWLVVLLVVLLLFGSGKISGLMGDLATGIKSFKKNIKEDEPDASMAETTAQPPAGNLPSPGTTQSAADPNRTVVRQPPGPV
jgi:sec-independent protein translocase protein TatA